MEILKARLFPGISFHFFTYSGIWSVHRLCRGQASEVQRAGGGFNQGPEAVQHTSSKKEIITTGDGAAICTQNRHQCMTVVLKMAGE